MDGIIRLRNCDRKTARRLVQCGGDHRTIRRAHVLLLLADGHSLRSIAAVLFCSFELIASVRRDYRRGGVAVALGTVTAKMEKEFCDIRPDVPTPRKKPSAVQTLLRSLLVQNHSLNAFGVQPADVVIAPDVTGFDLTEFTRAKEMAALGEAATLEQIQQLLARLDPQLFRNFSEAATAQAG